MKVQQEQLNAHNLITNNAPADILTVDYEQIAKNDKERRAAQDAAVPKAEESLNLRLEYEDLHRRLVGQPEEKAWKHFASDEEKQHNAAISHLERLIKYNQELAKSPGARTCAPRRATPPRPAVSGCSCDVCVFEREIEKLQSKLTHQQSLLQKSIRVNGQQIRNARELDRLRPRYAELSRMFRNIDEARKTARGLQNTDLVREDITAGDRFRQQSRHLRWEPGDSL